MMMLDSVMKIDLIYKEGGEETPLLKRGCNLHVSFSCFDMQAMI